MSRMATRAVRRQATGMGRSSSRWEESEGSNYYSYLLTWKAAVYAGAIDSKVDRLCELKYDCLELRDLVSCGVRCMFRLVIHFALIAVMAGCPFF